MIIRHLYRLLMVILFSIGTIIPIQNSHAQSPEDSLVIVILGSSTAAGTGASSPDLAWVSRYRYYMQSTFENVEVINLALGGFTTYSIMPDGFVSSIPRPLPDPNRNVTKALSFNPDVIIINLPSNDVANGYSLQEQLFNLDSLKQHIEQNNIALWVGTTQPRNMTSEQNRIQEQVRDTIFSWFGDKSMDFWYGFSDESGNLLKQFDSGDGIHLNDRGHELLYQRALESGAGMPSFKIELLTPAGSGPLNGSILISWIAEKELDSLQEISVAISRDNGKNWYEVWEGNGWDTSYLWESENDLDGLAYKVRLLSLGELGYGKAQSVESFVLDNPINSQPEIQIIAPSFNSILSDTVLIEWLATDVETSDLKIDLKYRVGNETWLPIIEDIENTGLYFWNTLSLANSNQYQIQITCRDDFHEIQAVVTALKIENQGSMIGTLNQISGSIGGPISVRVVDPSALTGHTYHIIMDDTSSNQLVYHVDNITMGKRVLENVLETDGKTEGPYFDGMRLKIENYTEAKIDRERSRWINGNPTLEISYNLFEGFVMGQPVRGYPNPSDYQLEVFEDIVDTSISRLGVSSTPINFSVTNTTNNQKIPLMFYEYIKDQEISFLDIIYFWEPDTQGVEQFTWTLTFVGDQDSTPPMPGDVLNIYTKKPYSSGDVFEFSAVLTSVESDRVQPDLFTLFQNYPNPFNPLTTIKYQLTQESLVYLAIYNILGQKVAELVNQKQSAGQYAIPFLANNLSSGIYFYQLKANQTLKSRKMVLLK